MSRTRLLLALGLAAVLTCRGDVAHAQVAADARYLTLESAHFRVTYEEGMEALARHTAASAERAHAALRTLVADAPEGTIDIVLADNVDFTNGYAMPFPSNRIVLYAHPPIDLLELSYMRDWIELVVTHELAHTFHLDVSGPIGELVRRIFGRLPAPWPLFPAVATPSWSTEGLATAVESAVTGYGRVHGSYHEMVVRTAVLEDEIDSIDRLTSASPQWPGATRVYIYGSLFMEYLERRFGPDAAARVVRSTAGAIIPPPLWFGNVARGAFGVSFREAYEDWERELEARYAVLTEQLRAEGLTTSVAVTSHEGEALFPRWSPDGKQIAYAAADRRRPPETRIVDASTRARIWSRRRNFTGPSSWLPDSTLLSSDLDFIDRFRIYSDLRVMSDYDEVTATDAARLTEPDSRDGARIVAVQNEAEMNRLVLVGPGGRITRALTAYDPGVLWSLPRFSPDGERIAVGRWRAGASDIVVMDLAGRVLLETGGSAGVSGAPAWSPDARWILFWSDRSGIANIYAFDTQARTLRQVTNVTTGAFYPDVSPDGRWLAFSAYHHDGYRIELMRLDSAQWRTPQPARGVQLTERPTQHAERARRFHDSIAAAVAMADTSSGAARRYGPVPHMRPYAWVPLLEEDESGHDYVGVWLFGEDLVDRHAWDLAFSVAPKPGRTQGSFGYSFRGLPTIPGVGLHPVPSVRLDRRWSHEGIVDTAGAFVDEREDVGAILLGFTRARIRSSAGFTIGADAARRSRALYNAPRRRLCDPGDDLLGIRGSAYYSRYSGAPYSISRENGVVMQVGARRRWDRDPVTCRVSATREVIVDAGYSEFTTWNTAYRALSLPGFARHVIAARVSGLLRDGPNASLSDIGGVNTSGLAVPGLPDDVAGGGRLLPLRGVSPGARSGTRAWTASLEYRFPIALTDVSLRPLPVFFDAVSAAAFLDAGHAWCDDDTRAATSAAFCPSTSGGDDPIMSAGAESTLWLSLFGGRAPVRVGAAWPLQGIDDRKARVYVVGGISF